MIAKTNIPVYETDSKGNPKVGAIFMSIEPDTIVLDTGNTVHEHGQISMVFRVMSGEQYFQKYFKLGEASVGYFLART